MSAIRHGHANSYFEASQLGTIQPRRDASIDGVNELIPNAMVIKGIPFGVKKEQIISLMTAMNLPLPYALSYYFHNGVFRGQAFANFASSEQTAMVIRALNQIELNDRRLRAEYKKSLPPPERQSSDVQRLHRALNVEAVTFRPGQTAHTSVAPSASPPSAAAVSAASSPRKKQLPAPKVLIDWDNSNETWAGISAFNLRTHENPGVPLRVAVMVPADVPHVWFQTQQYHSVPTQWPYLGNMQWQKGVKELARAEVAMSMAEMTRAQMLARGISEPDDKFREVAVVQDGLGRCMHQMWWGTENLVQEQNQEQDQEQDQEYTVLESEHEQQEIRESGQVVAGRSILRPMNIGRSEEEREGVREEVEAPVASSEDVAQEAALLSSSFTSGSEEVAHGFTSAFTDTPRTPLETPAASTTSLLLVTASRELEQWAEQTGIYPLPPPKRSFRAFSPPTVANILAAKREASPLFADLHPPSSTPAPSSSSLDPARDMSTVPPFVPVPTPARPAVACLSGKQRAPSPGYRPGPIQRAAVAAVRERLVRRKEAMWYRYFNGQSMSPDEIEAVAAPQRIWRA